MILRVVIPARVRGQIAKADIWWRGHSARPDLVLEELARIGAILVRHPEAGTLFLKARQQGVRCYPFRETDHILFYRVDRERGVVRILCLWHTSRGSGPPL